MPNPTRDLMIEALGNICSELVEEYSSSNADDEEADARMVRLERIAMSLRTAIMLDMRRELTLSFGERVAEFIIGVDEAGNVADGKLLA
ncbi:hypothetical protein [Nocardia sp. IFM 10818]